MSLFLQGVKKESLKKISFEQFKIDIKDDKKLYDAYNLPKRSTLYAAGYEFEAIEPFTI